MFLTDLYPVKMCVYVCVCVCATLCLCVCGGGVFVYVIYIPNGADIVFLTAWYPVAVPQLYNPVTSLLGQWSGMKTVGQIRHERGIAVPLKTDSLYQVSLLSTSCGIFCVTDLLVWVSVCV